ncbi:hypothetical protein MIR68_007120 [Amoeboaphelidium protococcarum]|nr:hypothetical protein MIR68_007120 [Amoeboaphelidium protococcarum]
MLRVRGNEVFTSRVKPSHSHLEDILLEKRQRNQQSQVRFIVACAVLLICLWSFVTYCIWNYVKLTEDRDAFDFASEFRVQSRLNLFNSHQQRNSTVLVAVDESDLAEYPFILRLIDNLQQQPNTTVIPLLIHQSSLGTVKSNVLSEHRKIHNFINGSSCQVLQFKYISQSVAVKIWPELVKLYSAKLIIASEMLPLKTTPEVDTIQVSAQDWQNMHWFGQLSVHSITKWRVPRIEIKIITFNRPQSLHRLLTSLLNADYVGDAVDVEIGIEALADGKTIKVAESFANVWPYGQVRLRRRVMPAGLFTSIVESWYPVDNHSYAVLLEDDIEVSPLFYVWLKLNLLKYRYSQIQLPSISQLYGISLYTPKVHEVTYPKRKFRADEEIIPQFSPFLFQVPCSWGALYFPEVWRQFHSYLKDRDPMSLDSHSGAKSDVVIPKSRSNVWRQSWKKFFIELVYRHGLVMLYPNFKNQSSFSTNHLEAGTHISDGLKRALISSFQVPLINRTRVELTFDSRCQIVSQSSSSSSSQSLNASASLWDLPLAKLPNYDALPTWDLFGKNATLESLIQNGKSLSSV